VSNCHLVAARSLIHLATSIGIGGHLAMPPLPHHRAYGSVPRRFGGLRALVKARCIAFVKLSRHGPFGLKTASDAGPLCLLRHNG
jgi:hypothetical protein